MLNLDTYQKNHQSFCSLPYSKIILNSWGDVSMCCHQLTQLGRLDEKTNIMDLWNGPIAKNIRKQTTNGNLHPVCRSGKSCPFIHKSTENTFSFPVYNGFKYPSYLEICLPDKHCNIGGEKPSEKNPACIMCKRNFRKPVQNDITDFLCEKAKPLFPYLKGFCVMGIAEPFWKNAVFEMFKKVEFQKYRDKIVFETNTNGTCLNEKECNRFFDEVSHSNISWSLDAATPKTHIMIRRLDALDLVVKNLKRWMSIRNKYGGKKHHKVSIYNNINLLNVYEMTEMVEMAVDIGVDSMTMLPTYEQSGIVRLGELLLCEKNVHIFKEQSEKAMARAQELGLNLNYQKRFDVAPTASGLISIKINKTL
jgi:hypothetical protein